MVKKYNKIKSILVPNKKINIFIISILILGIISGSIFATVININDKTLVIDKIRQFISNINSNSLNTLDSLKNSLSINFIYTIIIWILGMTIIGILFNLLLLYIKGFIFGFSLSAFIITYSYKGIFLSFIYTIFGQLLNIITIILLSIYSLMFTNILIKQILKNNPTNNSLKFLKNYSLILLISIIINIFSALSESFLLPTIIKLIIKLFI